MREIKRPERELSVIYDSTFDTGAFGSAAASFSCASFSATNAVCRQQRYAEAPNFFQRERTIRLIRQISTAALS
jgi:hypothetical protein